ncbi:S-layer homology domain-containing protein [Paenibacillus sp.]|uniref:S-layer homology domain-containing protein n=1 Tax=Paenibacillus sp. TaxID=58172 RepID=UPI002810A951|nr:S-layer homology domain-containing protein [Paenibacillus sp.]
MKATIVLSVAVLMAATMFVRPAQAEPDAVTAMWAWDYNTSVSTEERRERLLRFSRQVDANVLFVGTRTTLAEAEPKYADLIRRAHAQGIRVFALAGKADWALAEHHASAIKHISQVLDFNARHPSTPFDGIQLDVEPYTLPQYADDPAGIGAQLLRLLDTAERLVPDELELNAAIPFWYAASHKPRTVDYNGVEKPLSHHILDVVDSVSIMAYRDTAAAQIELSSIDVAYAGKVGKLAYVGAETLPPDGERIPDYVTYSGKNVHYMKVQMEAIRRHYAEHPGFGGVAVHTYDAYQAMLRQEEETMERQFRELRDAGIMTGYPDGTTGFGKPTTRAEVAAIAARIAGYTEATLERPAEASFRDVSPRQWFYGWVESARRIGAVQGNGDGTFEPNGMITVEEAFSVMAKTIGLAEDRNAVVPGASDWAQSWIGAMTKAGYQDRRPGYRYEMAREELVELAYETYRLKRRE